MASVGIAEAARMLGLSQDTVRKRVRSGELPGKKVDAPGGFRWMVELEDRESAGIDEPRLTGASSDVLVDLLTAQVQDLRDQLEARTREISELHQLMGARSLQPGSRQPWWVFWRK